MAQSAFADILNDSTDIPICLNQLLVSLNNRHNAMWMKGIVREYDPRNEFTEECASVITDIHSKFYTYLKSVFLYNQALYMALKTSEYHIHLYGTVLILEY